METKEAAKETVSMIGGIVLVIGYLLLGCVMSALPLYIGFKVLSWIFS